MFSTRCLRVVRLAPSLRRSYAVAAEQKTTDLEIGDLEKIKELMRAGNKSFVEVVKELSHQAEGPKQVGGKLDDKILESTPGLYKYVNMMNDLNRLSDKKDPAEEYFADAETVALKNKLGIKSDGTLESELAIDYEMLRSQVDQIPGEEHPVDILKRRHEAFKSMLLKSRYLEPAQGESVKSFLKRAMPVGKLVGLLNPDYATKEVETALDNDFEQLLDYEAKRTLFVNEMLAAVRKEIAETDQVMNEIEKETETHIERHHVIMTAPMEEVFEKCPEIANEIRDEISRSDWSTDMTPRA